MPNKKRKAQINTPTKSTTNNPANFRKKHQTNHQTSTNESILNLNIRGFRNGKEELIRILSDVTQIGEPAVILL